MLHPCSEGACCSQLAACLYIQSTGKLQLAQRFAAAAADQASLCVQIIGGPLAAALLSMDGWCGLQGWQWCAPVQQPALNALRLSRLQISEERSHVPHAMEPVAPSHCMQQQGAPGVAWVQ